MLAVLLSSCNVTEKCHRLEIAQDTKMAWVNCSPFNDQSAVKPMQLSELVGNYYKGDGTGENQFLSLVQDGEFSWQWRGCLGTYGTASGVWLSNGNQIVLKVNMKTGYKIAPKNLKVILYNGDTALIPVSETYSEVFSTPNKYDTFMREGSSTSW